MEGKGREGKEKGKARRVKAEAAGGVYAEDV